jgi:hypothetical protein
MSTREPDEVHRSADSTGHLEAPPSPLATADRPVRSTAILAIGVGAGILAGLAAWAIGEGLRHVFRPPLQRTEMMGHVIWKARYPDQAAADYKNGTIAFSVLGTVLGGCLSYAGSLARGSGRAGIKVGLAAMVLGGVLAAASSLALLPVYFAAEAASKEELSRDLILPAIVHGGIWAAAGLGGGLGLGLGLGFGPAGLIKSALGGLIGGAIGAVLYLIVGAMLFSSGNIAAPLATAWYHRLIARLLAATLAGALAATFAVMDGQRASGAPG